LGPPPPERAKADTTLTISVRPLKPGIYAAKVRYSWVGWFEQADGVVLVDAGPDEYAGSALADTIRARSGGKPVRTVVLTHAHDDHIMGARPFLAKGARLVAHSDAAAAIDSLLGRAADSKGAASGATIRVKGKYDLGKGVRAARVVAMGPAHTKGDVVVYLPKEKILFAGDLVSYKSVPWMLDPGMSIPGWRAALDSLMTPRFAADSLVPGHGEIGPQLIAAGWTNRYLMDLWDKAKTVDGWGSSTAMIKEWGYLGAYQDLEFYEEVHYMNLRRVLNEVKGIKTPGRRGARAVKHY
jgi:glyoxylase-like metal-dependent hydrolase (beta-lactamase superfamily II)